MKYIESHGGREKYFKPLFKKDRTNDCSIRAIAHALDKDYMEVMKEIFSLAIEMVRMPNDDLVVETYMNQLGYKRHKTLTQRNGDKLSLYCVEKFPHKTGVYLIRVSKHWTCVKEGVLYDTWNCSRKACRSFYHITGGK